MIKVKNRNVISESSKAYTVKVAPKRILSLPKSPLIQINKTDRQTTFLLSEWLKNKLTNNYKKLEQNGRYHKTKLNNLE